MNPEIQRLTNLRNFFIAKRQACEEEIRLQESKIKLWTESAEEVAQAIAQAEKEQVKAPESDEPKHCLHCGFSHGLPRGGHCQNVRPVTEPEVLERRRCRQCGIEHTPPLDSDCRNRPA